MLTVLAEVPKADFVALRETLDVTAGNLSRHLAVLEEAGYVQIDKVFEARKPRTWARITRAGRTALAGELQSLRELLG